MKILMAGETEGHARLMADSAWRPHRRPLFMPEDGVELRCRVLTALRCDRLGKCVSERFAPRYLLAVTAVCVTDGDGMNEYSDDSLIHGEWLPAEEALSLTEATVNGTTVPWDVKSALAQGYKALERLSRKATFKTGDVLIMPVAAGEPFIPHAGGELKVTAGDTDILEFTIR